MTYNPEHYNISIRLENFDLEDGNFEQYYVGRVAELPDITEFGDTAEEARALVIDTLTVAMTMYAEQNRPFPAPSQQFDVVSNPTLSDTNLTETAGKVTVHLPKTLHKNLVNQAIADDISLNTLLVALLAQGSMVYKNMYKTV